MDRRFVFEDSLHHGPGLGPGHQNIGPAAYHRHIHHRGKSGQMKKRKDTQFPLVSIGQIKKPGLHHLGQAGHVPVSQGHALGKTGCSAGKGNESQAGKGRRRTAIFRGSAGDQGLEFMVIRLWFEFPVHFPFHQREKPPGRPRQIVVDVTGNNMLQGQFFPQGQDARGQKVQGDDRRRLRSFHLILKLPVGIKRVVGHRHGAHPPKPVVGNDYLGNIGQEQSHPVARLEADFFQGVGQTAGQTVQFGIGDLSSHILQGDPIRISGCRPRQKLGHGDFFIIERLCH